MFSRRFVLTIKILSVIFFLIQKDITIGDENKMDYILRATAGNGSVRAFAAKTKETVNTSFLTHKTSPVMTAALGRTLTAGSLMGCMLKDDKDILTINIKGNGPGGGIIVTANNKVEVKGYCFNNLVDIPLKPNGKLDVSGALGDGSFTVIKDLGLKEPYVGQIPLVSGEIAEDLTYYFATSEQIPSAVALGVLVDRDYTVKQAGGFIIQKIQEMKSITAMFEAGYEPSDILNDLLGNFNLNILDKIPVSFHCGCSKERVEKALLSVGKAELDDIIENDKKAVLHCHFCNTDYEFDEDYLKKLRDLVE